MCYFCASVNTGQQMIQSIFCLDLFPKGKHTAPSKMQSQVVEDRKAEGDLLDL